MRRRNSRDNSLRDISLRATALSKVAIRWKVARQIKDIRNNIYIEYIYLEKNKHYASLLSFII